MSTIDQTTIASLTARSGFISLPNGVLAVRLTYPRGSDAAAFARVRGAVVLCPPLFEERKASAIAYARVASELAAAGFITVRLDPFGTGDSPGGLESATVERWLEDLICIQKLLAERNMPVILFGARFGGLLARAAHARLPADALVAWEPFATGAEALRQAVQRKLVNDMAAFGSSETNRAKIESSWENGETVDLDGYRVSAALAAGLLALEAPDTPESVPSLTILARAQRGGGNATARDATKARGETLVAGGAECGAESGLCHSVSETWIHPTPPFWTTVGLVDVSAPVQALGAWLVERFSLREVAFDPSSLPLEASHEGETHVKIVREGGGAELEGVWQSPDTAAPRMQVLCLTGWTGSRLGPHNVFVSLSRHLAQVGVSCLRMDFGGRGDSFGDPEKTTIASMTEEAKAALAWMRGRSGGGAHVPTVIVAICSGCKVAIGAAAEVEGLRGLCLWSPEPMGALRPRSTNRRKTLAMLRVYARKLLRPETWRKIFGGRVRGAMVGKALMRHETRGDDEARREDDVLAKFQAYDGEILAVFGSGDPEAAGSEKVYAEYCRRYDISLERHVIVRAGHSFYRAEWADELLGMTLEWIKRLAGAENQDKAEDSGRGE